MSDLLSLNWAVWETNNDSVDHLLVFIFSAEFPQKKEASAMLREEHSFVHPAKCVWRDTPYLHAVIQIHYTMRTGQLNIITSVSALEHLTWWERARDREYVLFLKWRRLNQTQWCGECSCSCAEMHEKFSARAPRLIHAHAVNLECKLAAAAGVLTCPVATAAETNPAGVGPTWLQWQAYWEYWGAGRRWKRHPVPHDPVDGFQIWPIHECISVWWWSDTNVIPYFRWDETWNWARVSLTWFEFSLRQYSMY